MASEYAVYIVVGLIIIGIGVDFFIVMTFRGSERNKPCWCGSGRKYKKCHYARDRDRQIAKSKHPGSDTDAVAVYLEHDDIYTHKTYSLAMVDDFARSIEAGNMCRALALMNYYLWTRTESDREPFEARQNRVARSVFDAGDQKKLKRVLDERPGIFIFPRQQILSLMARRLQLTDSDGCEPFDKNSIRSLGRHLLAISSLMQESAKEASRLSSNDLQKVDQLIAHLFRLQRLGEREISPSRSIGRYWYLYLQKYPKFASDFESAMGVELKSFMLFCFALRAHFHSERDLFSRPDLFNFGSNLFANMTSDFQETVKVGLELISKTVQEFRGKFKNVSGPMYYGYGLFWKYPLLRIETDSYCILDQQFLEEKLTSGLLWMLHDHYLEYNLGAERQALRREWGVVIERYVIELVEDLCDRCEGLYYEDLSGQKGRADCVLSDYDTCVYIESTVERMNLMRILDESEEALRHETERILFDGERNRGKMTQLADECLNHSGSKGVFSIIVTEESWPEFGTWYDLISMRYKEVHEKRAPSGFMILTLGDFEDMLNLVICGHKLGKVCSLLLNGVVRGIPFSNRLQMVTSTMHPILQIQYNAFGEEMVRVMFGGRK